MSQAFPRNFYFVAVIEELFHPVIQTNIAQLRAHNGSVRYPGHQRGQLVSQAWIDVDHILVAIESMLGEYLFEHKGCDSGYTRSRDFLSLELLWARDSRPGQQPLMHPVR
jgi:hypothetical protein